MLNDAEKAAFRQQLIAERDALLGENRATQSERGTVELDQQSVGRLSRMDALQRQAMAKAVQNRRGNRLKRIASALSRIEDGEFGFCHDCGDDIDRKRLEIDPTTPKCLSCTRG